jgi:hypothetical protein
MKTILATVIGLPTLIAALSAFHQTSSDVFGLSAYESGFNHGATDGKDTCLHMSGCHWYILEPGKGFAFYSNEFVRGYVVLIQIHQVTQIMHRLTVIKAQSLRVG